MRLPMPKKITVVVVFMHAQGLITDERQNIDPDALPFARKIKEIHRQGLREGASLVEVVRDFFIFSCL